MLIQDAISLLNSFSTWANSHVKREGNQIAHALAKNALAIESNVIDLEVIPDCIRTVIHLDT